MTDSGWSDMQLGADDAMHEVTGSDALQQAVAAMAGQARRQIDILTPDMEATLYDTADFLGALRRLAVDSTKTHVRILIADSERAVKRGHRLIEMARRLSTAIDLHQPGPESQIGREAFLLVDDRGLFWRADADELRASVSFNDPMGVRRLRAQFDGLWEESHPDPELRRLHV